VHVAFAPFCKTHMSTFLHFILSPPVFFPRVKFKFPRHSALLMSAKRRVAADPPAARSGSKRLKGEVKTVKTAKKTEVKASKKPKGKQHREPVQAYADVSPDRSPPPSPTRISPSPSPSKETLPLVSDTEQMNKLEAEMGWLKSQFLKNAKRENEMASSPVTGGNAPDSLLVCSDLLDCVCCNIFSVYSCDAVFLGGER
jgi:hypothetical protein